MGFLIDTCIWIDVERGRLAAALKTQGRAASFRVPDIWLAAQAIQHDLQLLTRKSRDFSDVPGLQLVEIR